MRIQQRDTDDAARGTNGNARRAVLAAICLVFGLGAAACSTSNEIRDEDDIKPLNWNFAPEKSVRLEPVELERTISEQGYTLVRYQFRGSGYEESEKYELRTRNLSGIEFVAPKVWFGEDGKLMFDDEESGDPRPFEVQTGNMLAGEGLSVAVYSPDFDEGEDPKVRARTDLVPHPIKAEGEGGCKLTVRVWPNLAYGVFIEGFGQGEALEMELVANDWSRRWPVEDYQRGSVGLFVVDPRDSGYRGGMAQFYADSNSCSVAVEFPYGEMMLPR
jgi:hypothetical protein